ncbi:unnamed protein product [Gulo gulo]|uniref:Uncharacterized protein n=1 Tax=Gulo gulo TaxID=48420 RepID=A0A9X9LFZ9_GULGU|nr:unnamed protein product [Gulo gulo]
MLHSALRPHSSSRSIREFTNKMPFCRFTSRRSRRPLDATRNRRGTSSASSSPRSCAMRPTKVPCLASSRTE